VPDPDCCWKYYECNNGCVTHEECEGNYKYDALFSWCTYPNDVDCEDRPCNDETHCPEPPTTTTEKPDCSPPEQWVDCTETGAGWFQDEYNCRAYWHCPKSDNIDREHLLCDNDEHGNPMMFNTLYMGCDFEDHTQCGGRPKCDECNSNCEGTSTTASDCIPPEQKISCKDVGAGYFPDEYNCRYYWHCTTETADAQHVLCPNDDEGNPEMFDLVYNGCNYEDLTECGKRPVCDECNQNCGTTGTTPSPIDCGHPLDCTNKEDGWYPDPYSCKKYWHCSAGTGQHMICDLNYMYEPVKIQCDLPERVNCGNRPPCNECDEDCHGEM